MQYKILESLGVEIENTDDAAFNNFLVSGESGIVKGVLDECKLVDLFGTIAITTGELLIQGFRIKITEAYKYTPVGTAAERTNYHIIGRLELHAGGEVSFNIITRTISELQQDDLHKLSSGIHEVELARFVHYGDSISSLTSSIGFLSLSPILKPEFAESVEWLKKYGDKRKLYVLNDKSDPNNGMIYAFIKSEIPGGEPLFANALDKSIDSNKSPFNGGLGYKTDTRLSSTSSLESTSNATNYMCSGFIDVIKTDDIYISGITGDNNKYTVVWFYDSTFTKIGTAIPQSEWMLPDENGVISFKISDYRDFDSINYMRFCGIPVTTYEDVICSVNKPIEYSAPSAGYAWTNTGHEFIPADYEDRIIAVEKKANSNTIKIVELENRLENGMADVLTDEEKLKKIREWDKPVFDYSPVTLLADDRVKPALTTADRTIKAIYAKYRALEAEHPRYITETNLGMSTVNTSNAPEYTGHDILCFEFKEPDGLTDSTYNPANLHETKPKIIFMSGVHTEWVGVWGLYYALEEITTNPEFDDVRRNAHIIVIPCSNPFVLTSQTAIEGWIMSHVNANGVAIHNNFNVDHSTTGTVGEYNYGGSAPCSELETQYIDKIMADNPDAVAFVSCHNNDYSTEFGTPVIWASSATYHMCNVVFRLIDKISKAWLNKYGDTLTSAIDTIRADFPALKEGDYRLGRATMSSSKGTEQKNATKYGIQGVNVEIARMMKVFSGNTDGTSEVMTHGAEVYANLMRTLLTVYDYKDKTNYYID